MARSVAVVGAGPGGLAAAMLLARAGCNVQVFERRDAVGGRASLVKGRGFLFDAGPTHLLYPQALERIFSACGYDLHRKVALVKADPMYRLVFEGGESLLCAQHAVTMEQRIGKISAADAKGFLPWLNANRGKFEQLLPLMTEPADKENRKGGLSRWKARRSMKAAETLDHDVGRYFKNPRLQIAFSASMRRAGISPYAAPASLSHLAYLEFEHGLWHPIGGVGGVCEIMAKIAEQMGVKIHLNHSVAEFMLNARRVTGVVTQGQQHSADAVVLGADFPLFMQKRVPYHLRPTWTTDRIRNAAYSCSHFVMMLGVAGKFRDLPYLSVFIPKDFRGRMAEIEELHRYPEQPMFWVQNPSVLDDTLAPRGMSTLVVHVPVTHRDPKIHWEHKQDLFRDMMLRKLRRVGIRKWPGHVRFQAIVTPRDWEHEYRAYNGASYGFAPIREQLLDGRPTNVSEDLDRLYVVGASTHPGVNLPGVFESARVTARLVLEKYGISAQFLDAPVRERRSKATAAL